MQLGSRQSLGLGATLPRKHPILYHQPLQCHFYRRDTKRARFSSTITAALYSLPENITSALHLGTTIAIAAGLGLSLLPILTGDSKERNERRFLQPNPEEGAENIRWGVMSVLAFLPFLNPMAWVFGAIDDEASSVLYWAFAWIYTMPYLANGFELDSYALAALVFGVVHMQIERIAQTEPVEVELPQVLRAVLRSLPKALTALGRFGSVVGEELGGRVNRSAEAQRRKPDRKYLEEKSREARMELDEFDRKRRARERERQDRK